MLSDAAHRLPDADLILAGGGLANGLLAWRLHQLRPSLRVLLLESGPTLGGNHTWSFHDADLSAEQHGWLKPLVAHRWSQHSVRFPGGTRCLSSGYASITSERFDAVLRADLAESVHLNARVQSVSQRAVTLADGSVLRAHAVVDGRGVHASPHMLRGYQKFLGQEWRLASPHGLQGPVMMDATVEQQGGYRFVYVLPFSADTVLVEDTVYADGDALDAGQLHANIAAYMRSSGWTPQTLLREEHGVLPIALDGDIAAFWLDGQAVPRAGLAAGLFHPTTGYSLPDAVQLAELVSALPDLSVVPLLQAIRAHALAQWQSHGFFRLLNRMLFGAAEPAERWRVMQRFYSLPAPLISRFYAGRPTWLDKARILSGKPPVPLAAAARAAFSSQVSRPVWAGERGS